ncbi:MAG: DUF937 domain-containing protein, partial [Planctomycetaceae bacterium]|nr:DUF937 domain-containing protein [Planctomycetaceae bacterium]
MNLVDLIKDQVSSEVTNKLSSLIGISEAQAKSAVGAAIPALLSALSGVTSSSAGAEKLASTINRLDAGALGKFADMLGGEPGQALQQGDNILG